jgi:hypothetical protein
MNDAFAAIVLGHLTGDYLVQSKNMALQKSQSGWPGIKWCLLHCSIYTTCVCLFLWTIDPLIIGLVFLSHFPIDRWSLASHWLKIIRGRDFLHAYIGQENFWEIDLSFSCLVYAVVDNAMHLILLWQICRLV